MQKEVKEIIDTWPTEPRGSAERLVKHYGDPDEYSQSQLIWYNTKDGWKRTVLASEEVPHAFPTHHTDSSSSSSTTACRLNGFLHWLNTTAA